MDSKWEVLEQSNEAREKIWGENQSFAGDMWLRFHRKPTAITGFMTIMLLMSLAFLGPLFTGRSYSEQNLGLVSVSPMVRVLGTPDQSGYLYITQNLKLLSVNKDGSLGEQLGKLRENSARQMNIYDCGSARIVLYYGEMPYSVIDPDTLVIAKARTLQNRSYLFGTDALGRDILTRLMYGTRVPLSVVFAAAGVNLILGIVYGGTPGYSGGWVDMAMMCVVDIISTILLTLYVILVMVLMGAGLQSIMVTLGTTYQVGMAHAVRGQVLSLKQQEFVLAAKTIGPSAKIVLLTHPIPDVMGSILVTVIMLIPSAIFAEALLGFLGIGLQLPLVSLGTMCNDVTENLRTCPYQLFIPALVIALTMFAFNSVGDSLRDVLDPKPRKQTRMEETLL